jgi:hypothetical protein
VAAVALAIPQELAEQGVAVAVLLVALVALELQILAVVVEAYLITLQLAQAVAV